jgi:mucin-19
MSSKESNRRRAPGHPGQEGQALAIVVIVMMLLIALSVSLANQSNAQAPMAEQTVLQRLALQAAQAGLADYQNFISESPLNASSFCSYSTFSCNQLSTDVVSGTIPGTITTSGGSNAPTAFELSGLISVTTSGGSQMSVSCTGSTSTTFTGCSGGTTSLLANSYATQFELPGDGDPAFASSFTTGSSCEASTVTNGWADATVSSNTSIQAAYQYVVNSTALYSNTSGGIVKVYSTGRAGTSGRYVCSAVQGSFWVQLAEPGVPQTVPTADSYSSVVVPSASCSPSCTTTTATFTVWGASGGNGGTGFSGTGGSGGLGEEMEATFVLPVGAVLGTDLGYQGVMAGDNNDPTTSIAVGSNGVALPTSTISVGSTSGFTPPLPIYVTATSNGTTTEQLVTCDWKTSTTFTNCSGGTGTLSTGGSISQPWSSGYGTGGASGNPGGGYVNILGLYASYSSSGSGGGASAVCVEPSSGGSCTSATPLCTGEDSSVPAAPGCVLVVAAGGGGAGEGDFGGSAGNGGNGGGADLPFSQSAIPTTPYATAEGEADAGGSGGQGSSFFGWQTTSAGGGVWTPSTPSDRRDLLIRHHPGRFTGSAELRKLARDRRDLLYDRGPARRERSGLEW